MKEKKQKLNKTSKTSSLKSKVKPQNEAYRTALRATMLADGTDDVLGGAGARAIVSGCAGSTSWLSTLGDFGLNPLIFRECVRSGVDEAGYVPPPIPATPATRLIDVVTAIQGAPRR